MRRRSGLTWLLLLWPVPLLAAPLPPDQCAKLASDVTALDSAGVKTLLEKGPAATKASLTRDQREQVRRYLDLLGQMRFRCPNETPFVTLRPEQPDEPTEANAATAPIEAGSAGITLPPGVAAAVVAPIAPKKPAAPPKKAASPAKSDAALATTSSSAPAKPANPPPQQKPAAKAAPVQPATAATAPAVQAAPAPARPRPAAKPKVDDALRPAPPAGDPAAVKAP